MTSSEKIKEIVAAALSRPDSESDQFIAGACGDDAAVLEEVRSLLKAHHAASIDGFLDADDAAEDDTISAPAEAPGTVIGRYKLLQQIGEGGFGAVFMAEQQRPVVRRVAL